MSSGRARGSAGAGMHLPLGWAVGPWFCLVRPVPPVPWRWMEFDDAEASWSSFSPGLALILARAAPEHHTHTQRHSHSTIAQARRLGDTPL